MKMYHIERGQNYWKIHNTLDNKMYILENLRIVNNGYAYPEVYFDPFGIIHVFGNLEIKTNEEGLPSSYGEIIQNSK